MSMRRVECADEESLGALLELPATDPRRAHLDTCPRCRALVMSHREFQTIARDAVYGPSEEAALSEFRARLGGTAPSARGAKSTAPWWSRLFEPAMRPAWALAVLAGVVGGVFLWPQRATHEPPTVRGGSEHPLALIAPSEQGDGSLRFAWHGVPDADEYQVRFYATAFLELGRVSAGRDTTVVVDLARLTPTYSLGMVILYRVHALHAGDEIAVSETGSFRRP
jgi:hypothetical protein